MVIAVITGTLSIPVQVFMRRNREFLKPVWMPDGEMVYEDELEYEGEDEHRSL